MRLWQYGQRQRLIDEGPSRTGRHALTA
jgi:hypothetical protein